MICPPFLKAGDKVVLLAPGRKISPTNIQASLGVFSSWGLTVQFSNYLFSNAHSYLSGTDAQRLEDFQSAINDDSVSAIICARGGYGSNRFVDQLDFAPLLKKPKWIVGFSDITALHLKAYSVGCQSIHSTMPILFGNPATVPSYISLKKVLWGELIEIEAQPNFDNKPGYCKGELVGGNLSLIIDAIGTTTEPNLENKILVIEEIDEYKYKVDRMINHLKRSGKLSQLAGLIVGYMTNLTDAELNFGERVEEIILSKTQDLTFPIAFGFPIGHENPNLAWRHGAHAELTVDSQKSLLSFS